MPTCQRIMDYAPDKTFVLPGNRKGHWLTTGYSAMMCQHSATRRLVIQTGPQAVTERVFCDECAAEYRQRRDRAVILADDAVDAVRTPVLPLSAYQWQQRFEWPAAAQRLAACGYQPGDRVQHRMLGVGLVLDVYPTRDDVIVLVDFGRDVRRLSLSFAAGMLAQGG